MRQDATRKALQHPYDGPFVVIKRHPNFLPWILTDDSKQFPLTGSSPHTRTVLLPTLYPHDHQLLRPPTLSHLHVLEIRFIGLTALLSNGIFACIVLYPLTGGSCVVYACACLFVYIYFFLYFIFIASFVYLSHAHCTPHTMTIYGACTAFPLCFVFGVYTVLVVLELIHSSFWSSELSRDHSRDRSIVTFRVTAKRCYKGSGTQLWQTQHH